MQRFTRPTTQRMQRYSWRTILALLSLAGLSLTGCAGTPWGEQLSRAVVPVIPETPDAAASSAPAVTTPVPDVSADATPVAGVLDDIVPDWGEPLPEGDPNDPIATLVAAGVLDEAVSAGSIRRSEFAR
ncbi:MAG: hypothetical protein HC926_01700 [Synechococcaceae cyanobacterium SM2_3_60]|nr:hypothetical protein [Synechococcaceae cyanobacterium SM2_3_60]